MVVCVDSYFPFFALFLTWPIVAEKGIEWSQGVH